MMLKRNDSVRPPVSLVMKMERWIVQILRLLDYLAQLLSWVFVAFAFLLCVVHAKEEDGGTGAFVALTFMSVVFHLLREAVEVWNTYPFWIDVERHAFEHRNVSAPLLITAFLLSFPLFFNGRVGAAFFSFLLFIVVNKFVVRSSQTKSEELFREFRSFFETDPDGNETVKSKEGAFDAFSYDFTTKKESLKGNNLITLEERERILMSQTRSRVNDREQLQGEALIEFDASSEVAFLNIAFCPPFHGVPAFDFEQIDGEEISLKLSLIQPFGVRMEARKTNMEPLLDDKAESSVKVAFYATFPPIESD